jgi:opacity protein-like surface antigen
MRKSLIFLAIVPAILFFYACFEAEAGDRRFFAGAGLSYAVEDFDDGDVKKLAGSDSIDNAWGFNLFAGYGLHKHFAVEGNFNWYDDFEAKADDINFDIRLWTLMLDLKVISPALLDDRLFPYLRIGAGWMETEVDLRGKNRDNGDFAYDVGLGFDVFVRDRISIGLDGKRVWGTGDVSEFNHFEGTLRVGYHF